MCLAVPGKIIAIADDDLLTMAEVDFHGVRRSVCVDTVDACVGDYIVAHAGVAVSVMDAATALATIRDLELMTAASGLSTPGPSASEQSVSDNDNGVGI